MKKTAKIKSYLILLFLTFTISAFAQYEDENTIGYDQIVEELTDRPRTRAKYKVDYDDPFASVLMHGGVGVTSSHLSIETGDGPSKNGFHKGVEFNFGIDLFSPVWIAEGTVRSFGSEEFDELNVSLKEFDLRLIHRIPVGNNFFLRFGGGLAARYLKVDQWVNNEKETIEVAETEKSTSETPQKTLSQRTFTTPSSIFIIGLDSALNKTVSLGIELAYRSALIEETIDKSAFDAILKVDTHF